MSNPTGNPPGRPSTYTKAVADEICDRLAQGESLRSICKDDHMPKRDTVVKWVLDDRGPGFAGRYTQARELGLDTIADEVFEIADDGSNDWMEKRNQDGSSSWAINGEALGRSRLRFDARRWYLSKLAPKRFGERVAIDAEVKDTTDMTDAQRAARIASLAALAKARKAGQGDEPAADEDDASDLV